jgi:zinc/manganese transport system substrate-binding protein
MIKGFTFLLLFNLVGVAHGLEKIRLVTTLPDLAEAARAIAGERAEVESLLNGTENAHFVDALPTFIKIVSRADIVCAVGLGLEVGWLPKVLSKSNNPKVQSGGMGFCELGKSVNALDKVLTPADRSMGDVHPEGNPHFNLSPIDLAQAALEIKKALIRTHPQYTQEFEQGYARFQSQMSDLKKTIEIKLKALSSNSSYRVIEYHKDFGYFLATYDLQSMGAIEEMPGVLPSAARLAVVSQGSKSSSVRVALGAFHSPEKHLRKFSELSGISHLKLPTMVHKKNESYNTIEKVQHAIADALLTQK